VRVGIPCIVRVCKFYSCVERLLEPRTFTHTQIRTAAALSHGQAHAHARSDAASAHAQSTAIGDNKQGKHGG
jgi:hypothetical protein